LRGILATIFPPLSFLSHANPGVSGKLKYKGSSNAPDWSSSPWRARKVIWDMTSYLRSKFIY